MAVRRPSRVSARRSANTICTLMRVTPLHLFTSSTANRTWAIISTVPSSDLESSAHWGGAKTITVGRSTRTTVVWVDFDARLSAPRASSGERQTDAASVITVAKGAAQARSHRGIKGGHADRDGVRPLQRLVRQQLWAKP